MRCNDPRFSNLSLAAGTELGEGDNVLRIVPLSHREASECPLDSSAPGWGLGLSSTCFILAFSSLKYEILE